jgi:hypothetical protein
MPAEQLAGLVALVALVALDTMAEMEVMEPHHQIDPAAVEAVLLGRMEPERMAEMQIRVNTGALGVVGQTVDRLLLDLIHHLRLALTEVMGTVALEVAQDLLELLSKLRLLVDLELMAAVAVVAALLLQALLVPVALGDNRPFGIHTAPAAAAAAVDLLDQAKAPMVGMAVAMAQAVAVLAREIHLPLPERAALVLLESLLLSMSQL